MKSPVKDRESPGAQALQLECETASATPVTRRSFLNSMIASTAASAALASTTGIAGGQTANLRKRADRVAPASTFLDLLRPPDQVTAFTGLAHPVPLERAGSRWQCSAKIEVTTEHGGDKADGLSILLTSPMAAVTHLHLRWRGAMASHLLVLGDAWERSYGDLGWKNIIPERVLPWYFATSDSEHGGVACHAYGVRTAPGAFCFWQIDQEGVSLWLNVQNGGNGVVLGDRNLHCATIVTRKGTPGEESFDALRDFCRKTCARPALTMAPMYGTNDWYYAYGRNTAEQILRDTDLVASLANSSAVRPFSVIDMGWENGSAAYGNMAELARQIQSRKVRPGIWVRPLKAESDAADGLLLPSERFKDAATSKENAAYDPTLPEAQQIVTARIRQLTGWGYELIKHDFSTFDLLGQWGFEMGPSPTREGWSFHDRSRTNAEIITDFYELIRRAAGARTLIIGCNTVGHLAQGLFEAQRTGDDTSGKIWERTRRMGINTLAFRLPQHGVYFVQDADCVGITPSIPWQMNRQWLDVLARSGTALFLSPGPGSVGPEQKSAIANAFALIAGARHADARALDWFASTTPQHWGNSKSDVAYDWCNPEGAYPFSV
jgi:alpha-galactosidase